MTTIQFYGVDGQLHIDPDGHRVGTKESRAYVRAKIFTGHNDRSLESQLEPCDGTVFFENPSAYLLWTGNILPPRGLKSYLEYHKLGARYTYDVPASSYGRWYRHLSPRLPLSSKQHDFINQTHDHHMAWYLVMGAPPPQAFTESSLEPAREFEEPEASE